MRGETEKDWARYCGHSMGIFMHGLDWSGLDLLFDLGCFFFAGLLRKSERTGVTGWLSDWKDRTSYCYSFFSFLFDVSYFL